MPGVKPKNNTSNLNIRISPALQDMIAQRTQELDLSISEYIRYLVLEDYKAGQMAALRRARPEDAT